MKIIKHTAKVIVIFSLLASCQKDLPEPETKNTSMSKKVIEVSGIHIQTKDDPFFVRHHVKGQDVFVECIIKGASFRNSGTKIILFIDGKTQQTEKNAAFVIKSLPSGEHQIKLELYKDNDSKALSTEEFKVVIP